MSEKAEPIVTIGISEDTLHDIVKTLGNALKPKVFYNPNQNHMLEDALKKVRIMFKQR